MNSPLQRGQRLMISKSTTHLMLGRRTPPHLQQSPLLSHRNLLRLNDNQTCDASRCSGVFRRPHFVFHHAFNHPLCLLYLCSVKLRLLWVICARSNAYDCFCTNYQHRLSPSEVQPKPPRPLERPAKLPALHNLVFLALSPSCRCS